MKVGILTTVHAFNYGALLQAYSLQQVLTNNFGRECEILDFNPQIRKEESIYYPNTNWRNIVRNVFLLCNITKRKRGKKRIQKFKFFKAENLNLSDTQYNCSNLNQSLGKYDCIVTGSDQIWNMSLFPGSYYFLDFADGSNIRRFSYAPSVLQPIHESLKGVIGKSLKGFSRISVREREDVDVIRKLAQREVNRVIDPVFLNSKDFWAGKEKEYKIPEPYILCYFLGGENASFNMVKRIKEITGLKVASFNLGYKKLSLADYDCSDADPLEFLYLINHASLVCTNSFHCTAFSIIFHKNFYLLSMDKRRNSRMLNIIQDYDIKDRIVDNDTIPNEILPINFDTIDNKMDDLRQMSLDYIYDALIKNI